MCMIYRVLFGCWMLIRISGIWLNSRVMSAMHSIARSMDLATAPASHSKAHFSGTKAARRFLSFQPSHWAAAWLPEQRGHSMGLTSKGFLRPNAQLSNSEATLHLTGPDCKNSHSNNNSQLAAEAAATTATTAKTANDKDKSNNHATTQQQQQLWPNNVIYMLNIS